MNKQRMYLVADAIEKEQIAKFNMFDFIDGYHTCKTAACVCGFAALLNYPNHSVSDVKDAVYDDYGSFMSFGEKYLEITKYEADELFNPHHDSYGTVQINNSYKYVPKAIRWMADNDTIDWDQAFIAIGLPDWKENE